MNKKMKAAIIAAFLYIEESSAAESRINWKKFGNNNIMRNRINLQNRGRKLKNN